MSDGRTSVRIPEEEKVAVHIIRQDYARALSELERHPGDYGALAQFEEISNRRARAMRSLHRDDNMDVRAISAIFRTSKTNVREALAAEEES